jgi:hypothetical protein
MGLWVGRLACEDRSRIEMIDRTYLVVRSLYLVVWVEFNATAGVVQVCSLSGCRRQWFWRHCSYSGTHRFVVDMTYRTLQDRVAASSPTSDTLGLVSLGNGQRIVLDQTK